MIETEINPELVEGVKWESDQEFLQIVREMGETYLAKNADYGNSFDKTLDQFGLVASAVRLNDKVNRISNLIINKEFSVKDESIEDTLLDLANYAVMTLAYIRKHRSSDDISGQ